MKSVRYAAILILFAAFPAWPDLQPLSATSGQAQTTLDMLEVLGSKHYSSQPVDDELSRELLENYLDALDPSRSYFLASDIEEFEQWRYSLDDTLKRGDLDPAFAIFNRYRERVVDRLEKNIALLQTEQPFDFTVDESLLIDSDERSWPADTEALDELWRKRVKDSYLRMMLAGKEEAEIAEQLIKRYRNQISQLEKRDAEDVYQVFMNAYTTIYDPHTNYFSPRQLENFNISMSLSLEGIGAVLQAEDEYTKVVRVVPGGPADKQGELEPQDKIIAVSDDDGVMQDVIGWRLDDVVDLIRGKKGTTVKLEVLPGRGELAETSKTIAIVRDEVKLEEQAAQSEIIEIENGGRDYRIGVIDVPAFYLDFEAYRRRDPNYKSTTKDVAKLLGQLKLAHVDGIIIDLRNNGGGSLHEATTLTDLFIEPGPVVQIRHTNQTISREYRSRTGPAYDGPLLVLVNRLSASASEIFAAAIQDYGRGLVVGTRSFGKGTVQVLTPVHEGQVKLTESKFYRVSGGSTQHRGVVPDIGFPSIYDIEEIGESSQEHALPWDEIHGIPVEGAKALQRLVPVLSRRHEERTATDPDFRFLEQKLALFERQRERDRVFLNADQRRQQKTENDRALLALENERRIAKGEEPYPDVEAWNADEDRQTDSEASGEAGEPEISLADDPLLKAAGMILADQIDLMRDATQLVQSER